MAKLQITLKRSVIASKPNHRATAKELGLTKTNKTVVKNDSDTIRGMIRTISHLVDVKEL